MIKGITIKLRGDTTSLENSLRRADAKSDNLEKELRAVNRALKFNPGNVDLLRQKQVLLTARVEKTKEKLKELKSEMDKLKSNPSADEQGQKFRKLERDIITTESKLKTFKRELATVKAPTLAAVGTKLKNVGQNMMVAGGMATAAGVGMVYAGKQFVESANEQIAAEERLSEVYQKRMGVGEKAANSTKRLASEIQKSGVIGDEVTLAGAQQLATFAKYPGTVNRLLPAMDNLLAQQKKYGATTEDAKNIANLFGKALTGQPAALRRVGISFNEAQEKILKYGNEEQRAAVLNEVITQNVGNMNARLAQTDYGKIVQLKNSLGDVKEEIGIALLPILKDFATYFKDNILPMIQQFSDTMKKHPGISKFLVGLTTVLAIGGPLLTMLGALTFGVGSLLMVLGPIAPMLLIIAGAIAGVIAFGVLLYKNWDKVKKKASELVDGVKKKWNDFKKSTGKIFKGIRDTIVGAFTSAKNKVIAIPKLMINGFLYLPRKFASIMRSLGSLSGSGMSKVINVFSSGLNKIKGFFKHLKLSFPHIKLPHFKISGKAPFGLGGKGKKISVGVDWYKNGGIFDRPTIIGVGEAGPEAVVPLDKNKGYISDGGTVFNVTINLQGGKNYEDALEISRRLKLMMATVKG